MISLLTVNKINDVTRFYNLMCSSSTYMAMYVCFFFFNVFLICLIIEEIGMESSKIIVSNICNFVSFLF